MKCKYCDNNISDSVQYCDICGQQVVELDLKLSNYEGYLENISRINSKYEEKAAKEKKNYIIKQKKQRRKIIIILCFIFILALIIFYVIFIKPVITYNRATDLYNAGMYAEAMQLYEKIVYYEDSSEKIIACEEGIIENEYQIVISLYEDGNYEAALYNFRLRPDYKDSEKYILECERALIREAEINEYVQFGYYMSQPLEWRIVERTEDEALLVARYYVADKLANEINYNNFEIYNCWSQSSLRKWLNKDFLFSAFNSMEMKYIIYNDIITNENDIENSDSVNYSTITVETIDKIYIPSIEDVELLGLSAVAFSEGGGLSEAWLRDCGESVGVQCTLTSDGAFGTDVSYSDSNGVLPMIRVRL